MAYDYQVIPNPSSPQVLRNVYIGEPSRARLMTWLRPSLIVSNRHISFAMWPAGELEPVYLSINQLEIARGYPLDSDDVLAAALWVVLARKWGCKPTKSQCVWLDSPEANALRLDLEAIEDSTNIHGTIFHDVCSCDKQQS